MRHSCASDEALDGLSSRILDECLVFSLDDVEAYNVKKEEEEAEEDLEAGFQKLELPSADVFTGFSCGLDCEFGSGSSQRNNSFSKQNQHGFGEASSGEDIVLHESKNCRDSKLFRTTSPVSVLEGNRSSSPGSLASLHVNFVIQGKRERTKRGRPPFAVKPGKKKLKKEMNLTLLSDSIEFKNPLTEKESTVRRCTHCKVTKTPQWREGPLGPKTLCNACGVRYRQGRLLPEYRPAASPTFVPSMHSNSHRRVIEIRSKAAQPATMTTDQALTSAAS